MPVVLNAPRPDTKSLNSLDYGQVAVIVGGMYDGLIVMRRSRNFSEGFLVFKKGQDLIDGFNSNADHPIRVLQSGESFTVIIP